ncbi:MULTISPECIES: DUF2849 domain-containing protein [Rhodobacterales]|uniref:DUF2849 domain-containing protein n=1 Tax=Parasulfitobacter algicola TaxID=2614809 RepID=A0ABX2IRR4_9RHOB|nr:MULTISPECIES: DUF2849 domain-containing protein [Rhodobacterales]NSX55602.1 DUF2849 domain-containing protein [Sulfitobacter algicola]
MSRKFTPKVVTANDLLEGDVIYLAADDRWVRDMKQAEFIEDEAHAQIRLLHAEQQPDVVVGAYLADAALGDDGPEPTHFRETFRTRGPSNYAHGKQEKQAENV